MGNELSDLKILSVGVVKEGNACPSLTKQLPVHFRNRGSNFWVPSHHRDVFKSLGSYIFPPSRFFSGWKSSCL